MNLCRSSIAIATLLVFAPPVAHAQTRFDAQLAPNPLPLTCQASARGTDVHRLPMDGGSLRGEVENVARRMSAAGYQSAERTIGGRRYLIMRQSVRATFRMRSSMRLAVDAGARGARIRVVDFRTGDAQIQAHPPQAEQFFSAQTRREIAARLERRSRAALEQLRRVGNGLNGYRIVYTSAEQRAMRTRYSGVVQRSIPIEFCGKRREVRVRIRWDRRIDRPLGEEGDTP